MSIIIKMACGAVQGRSHVKKNIVCQDKVFAERFPDKRSAIVCLADGAGSCSLSHIGAQYAVSVIGKIIHNNFKMFFNGPKTSAPLIIARLRKGLHCLANKNKASIKELSSTLLFVYLRKENNGIKYFAGHIGDGIIAIQGVDSLSTLSHPENGEYANTTVFTTAKDAAGHLRIYTGFTQKNCGFLLMSDGVSESLYLKKDETLAPACKNILDWFDSHSQAKIQVAIKSNIEELFITRTFDDCSLAAIKAIYIQPRASANFSGE